jgi:hypothetical protein
MSFHIVTDRCFLTCEKVVAVVIEETFEEKKTKVKKTPKKVFDYCTISITYVPVTTNNYDGQNCIELRVEEKAKAMSLYAEIVKQVQEQFPNEVFLDKLVSRMLGDAQVDMVTKND